MQSRRCDAIRHADAPVDGMFTKITPADLHSHSLVTTVLNIPPWSSLVALMTMVNRVLAYIVMLVARRCARQPRRRRARFATRLGYRPTATWTLRSLPGAIVCEIATMLPDRDLMALSRTCRRHAAESRRWPRTITLTWYDAVSGSPLAVEWPPELDRLLTTPHNIVTLRCREAIAIPGTSVLRWMCSTVGRMIGHAPRLRELQIPLHGLATVCLRSDGLGNLTSLASLTILALLSDRASFDLATIVAYLHPLPALTQLAVDDVSGRSLRALLLGHHACFPALRSLSFSGSCLDGTPWWHGQLARVAAFLPAVEDVSIDGVVLVPDPDDRRTGSREMRVRDIVAFVATLPTISKLSLRCVHYAESSDIIDIASALHRRPTTAPDVAAYVAQQVRGHERLDCATRATTTSLTLVLHNPGPGVVNAFATATAPFLDFWSAIFRPLRITLQCEKPHLSVR
jgi:hypothetical protein